MESELINCCDFISLYPNILPSVCETKKLKFPKEIQIESFHQNVLTIQQHTILGETKLKMKNLNNTHEIQ